MDKKVIGPTVALESLGCKLNQAEIMQLAGRMAAAGYRIVPSGEKVDIYVLNTCTVTHVADRKSRHLLRLARRRNPSVRLVAIGCYAERAPGELDRIEGMELVLGNEQKWQLPELLETQTVFSPVPLPSIPLGERTRAFVKVQDGCRNFCAYCIVPLVRNRLISVPVASVLAQVKERVATDFKEVVLTGTEIGDYQDGGLTLKNLLEHILEETGVTRLRLSSLQPRHITLDLIGLWKDPRLCPHFHLSLQSGSDTILKKMNRRYTTADYRRAVELIHAVVPDVAITTDIIVGFSGESEVEFRETIEFCRQMKFARIHVFPYSPRPETAAATMPGQVGELVKRERSRRMLTLAKGSAKDYQRQYLNRCLEVLWEQSVDGIWSGLTGNYIRVYARSSENLTSRVLPVELDKVYRDGMWGEVS